MFTEDISRWKVTRALNDWDATDRDIRAFMTLSHRWADSGYDEIWEEAKREFGASFDPDRDDPADHVGVFDDKVGGLWAPNYVWILRSGALRDAVTAFEVYAEKCIMEFLNRFKHTTPEGNVVRLVPAIEGNQLSPSWSTLRAIHAALGSDIDTSEVKYVRSLRHLLTHRRGELRTEEERDRFIREAVEEDWLVGDARVGGDVPLAHRRVVEMMDDLAGVVHASDRVVFPHAWGGAGFPSALYDLVRSKQNKKGVLIEQPLHV